jgi:hypothetical protein
MSKHIPSGNENLKYKVYLEERKLLVDASREGARSFDKTILALASGAFGISLTFIRQIVPNIKSGTIFMLICSWVCFCICLLSTLISFLTSQSACLKQIEILEAEPDKKVNIEDIKNKSSDCTRRLNILSISVFILGIIFLISFSISNLLP